MANETERTPEQIVADLDVERTFTPEEIADTFKRHHGEADRENRDATAGHFNPYGDAFEDLTWHGTIAEALDQKDWPRAEDDGRPDPKDAAARVVGSGRPVYVAFTDGQYPTVFCERSTWNEVEDAVMDFYPAD